MSEHTESPHVDADPPQADPPQADPPRADRRIGADVVCALALFLVAGVLLPQTGDGLQDWLLPRALNYLLIGIGVILLVNGLVRPRATVPVVPPLLRGKGLDVVAFFVAAGGYVTVMPLLGFWLSSVLVVLATSVLLTTPRTRRSVLVSLAVAVGVCTLFAVLLEFVFYVPFPVGDLFS